jgi:succinyl-diaminopimelate desuccinylase
MSQETDSGERLADLITALVRIESENPPGNERACAQFIYEWLLERDIDAELLDRPFEDRPQVAARVGSGEPTVVLNGHLDTVPAGDPDSWEYPPFGGEREDGRLYGRGSVDMKTGLAIAMLTMVDYRDRLPPGTGTLVFHGAIGEETGDPGTRTLLEAGYDGTYGIVLEPTDFHVATRAKGLVCYNLTVHGESSHASRPDQGDNAILQAQPVIEAIASYDDRLRTRTDELVGSAYASVTEFAADVGGNLGVIPGEAEFVLDRRVLPGESISDVETEVSDLLDAIEAEHGIDVTYEEIQRYEPASVPTHCSLAELLRSHTRTYRNGVDNPWGIEAATDVRNLVHDAGMEAVTWGPGSLAEAHTVDESVDLDAAADGYVILHDALDELIGNTE